jgi:tetratricopeptide (TPR) repeat protein
MPRPGSPVKWWMWAVGLLAAFFVAFEVYGPALNGEFLFDDVYLPFLGPEMQTAPLRLWLGVRPVLMLSYWLNYQWSGLTPYPYHAVGVVLHVLNAVLAWSIVRRLLGVAGEQGGLREVLALFAGGLFLLHPVQTESVAYVASRSETLSVLFFLGAYAVFLYRPAPVISWGRALLVLLLFAIACSVKEHTTVLPGLLLLTDYYFTTPFRLEGARRNLKLYGPVLVLGLVGVAAVWRVLSTANSAGFRLSEFTWYQYLFTQFRVILTYLRLYVLPVGLNGDYDFPASRTIFDQGAVVAMVVLLALLWFAWRFRTRFPLASFGFIGFLLLLAPTSSVVPIQDVIVERRLYLPFVCLLLITVDFLRRWRPSAPMMAAVLSIVLAVAGTATYFRSQVWSSALAFWEDTVKKSPNNSRARFQLAFAQWHAGNCGGAVKNYEAAAGLTQVDERLLVDWALALDCLNRVDDAVAKLREAARLAPSAHVYAQIGMVYGKHNRGDEALAALAEAEKLNPGFDMTYVYRGNVFATRGDLTSAVGQYRRALALNPNNETAQQAVALAERQLAQPR